MTDIHKLRVLYLINLAPFVFVVFFLFNKIEAVDMTLSLPATAVKGLFVEDTESTRILINSHLFITALTWMIG